MLKINFFCALQNNTKLPIIVKGVQSLEDVEMCVSNGVEGVVIVSRIIPVLPASMQERTLTVLPLVQPWWSTSRLRTRADRHSI